MPIVSLPLTNQLPNGSTADGGQVLADLNSIASQVNANAAANGVNNDITQLLALVSVPAAVTATGWTLNNVTINSGAISGCSFNGINSVLTTPAITGGTAASLALTSATLDGASTGVTQPVGTNTNQLATMTALLNQSFSSALPLQPGNADKLVTTDGITASWARDLKATVIRFKDGTDATKLMQFSLSGISTLTTRTVTVPDKNGTMAMLSDLVLTTAFLSADQTITAAGALTIAHSLGAIPKIVLGYVKCVTGEGGYTAGDVVCYPLGQNGNGVNAGISVVVDATNLNVRFASLTAVLGLIRKDTGAAFVLTPANWSIHFRAFA